MLEDASHKGVQAFVKDLNHLYTSEKALWDINEGYGNFEWIDCENAAQKVLSFVRKGAKDSEDLIAIVNFSDVDYEKYRVGVPYRAAYLEVLNSDDEAYAGKGQVNKGVVLSEDIPWHGRSQSIEMTLPQLSIVVFKIEKMLPPKKVEPKIKHRKKRSKAHKTHKKENIKENIKQK